MSALFAIAHNTFREAIRDRVLYLLLFFGLLVVVGSEALAVLAVGEPQKVVMDLGLASVHFFGVLVSVFLGLSLVAREIERRTVFTVVSKPIGRGSFLGGKLLGLYATVVLLTLAMTIVLFAFLWLRYGAAPPRLLLAIFLMLIEDLVLASFALLFASFTTPILGTLFTLTVFVVGHVSFGLKMLAEYPSLADTGARQLVLALYYVLPNLERFNVKGAVVHGVGLPEGVLGPALYGVVYAAGVFVIALETFRRRDFV